MYNLIRNILYYQLFDYEGLTSSAIGLENGLLLYPCFFPISLVVFDRSELYTTTLEGEN